MRITVFSRFLPLSATVLAAFALGGCSSFNEPASLKGFIAFISPYRPDVIQGNVVTSEQIALVKPGMSRVQVKEILGTPLITDPFHADRWDYVFTLKRQGFDDQERAFAVMFEKDQVQKIDAPELPSEDAFVAQISRKKLPTSTPKLELTEAEKAALPAPAVTAAPAASAVEVAGATRSYPPLETATP
ncbi:MAG TPA: outer membrane protein assembly factor BamE [Burkholderiaceae bacterium]|jgi:outer membrane protein assembly factor BamE|nr:outer membrane protein assembly factor BamE [Burkholderiaceae bacterium]